MRISVQKYVFIKILIFLVTCF